MNDKDLAEFIDLLYPYFIKKLKKESVFKNNIKSVNATVKWVEDEAKNIGKIVKIKFPYDTSTIDVINRSSDNLKVDDLVCVHYFIDLKNAYVAYKV